MMWMWLLLAFALGVIVGVVGGIWYMLAPDTDMPHEGDRP